MVEIIDNCLGNRDSRGSPGDGDEQVLQQKLPDNRPAARADRQSNGDLARPRPGAAQQQPRDVRARHQQHADAQDREHRHHRGVRPGLLHAQLQRRLHFELLVVVRGRVRPRQFGRDRGDVGLRLRHGDARLQPRLECQPPRVPLMQQVRAAQARRHGERNIQRQAQHAIDSREAFGSDAHNGEFDSIEADLRPNSGAVAIEYADPGVVAEHRDGLAPFLILFRPEAASYAGFHAEHAKEVSRYVLSEFHLRLNARGAAETETRVGAGRNPLEAAVVIAKIQVVGVRHRRPPPNALEVEVAVLTDTTLFGCATGSGRSSILFARLNMEDVAPIPTAIEHIATTVKVGSFRNTRNACFSDVSMASLRHVCSLSKSCV